MRSYWQQQVFERPFDLIVIGAGIVGLHSALFYKRSNPNKRVCVIERGPYPSGASVKNAGFACFGSPSELLADIVSEGTDQAMARVHQRWEGLNGLRSELGDDILGLIDHGGYELFTADSVLYTSCSEKLDQLNELLLPIIGRVVFSERHDIIQKMGFSRVSHALGIDGEASINTGQMMHALWQRTASLGVEMIVNTAIRDISTDATGVRMESDGDQVFHGEQVIVATNGYARELLPDIPLAPGRGQVIMTSEIADLRITGNHHLEQGYYYFRPVGRRILLGGGRELDKQAEETSEEGLTPLVQSKLETLLKTIILPDHDFTIEQRWSGIMAFGPTKEPLVARIDDRTIIAVRSGGMGVAIGHTLGKRAAALASS
jgi:glycine/D-amino acid oxidase-like deaminating enzyme